MASRSFKPASYLASAAQQPSRSPRPAYTRSSSTSSILSTKSDDSFVANLRSLSTIDREKEASGGVAESPNNKKSTSSLRHELEDSPGRKRSDPIAIERPWKRHPKSYTPLTARGDLLGGYFPNHEDLSKSYKNPSFFAHGRASSTASSPSGMSNTSSALPSPTDATSRPPLAMLSPAFHAAISAPAPLGLTMPLGKYHPSNYNSPNTSAGTSNNTSTTNLRIPSPSQRTRKHERRTSDVAKKLHEYQREMIIQARLASMASTGVTPGVMTPGSPKLEPLGSPGPITPFELEEGAGWLGLDRREIQKGHGKRRSSLLTSGFRASLSQEGGRQRDGVEGDGKDLD